MMKLIRSLVVGVCAGLSLAVGAAVDVAGVKFEDKVKLGATELNLNGAGVRTRFMVKVYAAGLYLPEKKTSADQVLALKGPKRVHIVTLRELTAEQFADALVEGIRKNSSEAELATLKPAIDEFRAAVLSLQTAPKAAVVNLDFAPETGTRLVFNSEPKGNPIAGEDFYRALLRIWLGAKPVQDDLKEALLGK